MEKKQKRNIKALKIIACLFVLSIAIYGTYTLLPIMRKIATAEGRIFFREQIVQSSVKGLAVLVGLEFAQIILAFLPGEPLEILAGMCYGSIRRNNIFNDFYIFYNHFDLLFCKKIWKEFSL